MLNGLMMHRPLLVSSIIDYAADMHPGAEIVSARVEGDIHRTSYPEIRKRIAQLAHGLKAMGVKPGDRIATLAWNGYRHFELYYAIAGIGAVCHTLNPRLSAEQFSYITNHAEDTMLFFDTTFTPLVDAMSAHMPDGIKCVAMENEEPATVCHVMDRLIDDLDSTELMIRKLPQAFVMIAGHIDHVGIAAADVDLVFGSDGHR